MFGLFSFHIVNQPGFEFSSNLGEITTVLGGTTFLKAEFSYFSLKERNCPGGMPYLHLSNETCLDMCLNGTYLQGQGALCLNCVPDCDICHDSILC